MKFRKTRLMKAGALCAAMMICSTTLGAVNADAFPAASLLAVAEDEGWSLDADGTLTITNIPYITEAPWAEQVSEIKKVVVGEGTTSLPRSAFLNCVNLTSVTLPEGFTCVNIGMFEGCSSLTEINLPDTVNSIYNRAFKGCSALKSITIPEKVSYINEEAFMDCTSLTAIAFPAKLYGFGSYAFAGCTNLTDITFPDRLDVVGRHVFEGTPWLKAQQKKNPLVIVNDVFLLDASACSGDVVIPDGVTGTGGAFADTDITSVTFPEGFTNINDSTFRNCTKLTEIQLPENLGSLTSHVFAGCTGLTSIEIPDTVTVFGAGAFEGCTNLKSVKLSAQIREIYSDCFNGCTSLENIEIPGAVRSIGSRAFAGCTSLKSITFPINVCRIEDSSLDGCTALEDITILNPICSFSPEYFLDTISTVTGYSGSSAQIVAETLDKEFNDLGVFADGPLATILNRPTSLLMIYRSGEEVVFNDSSMVGILSTGAKITEVEAEVENLAELPLTQNELTTTIEDSSLYKVNSYDYHFYEKDKPVSIVRLNANFTVTDDITIHEGEVRFVFTKVIDENGNDLLADKPDHKITLPCTIRFIPRTPIKPTEPATEPATEPVTEPATEPETEPVTEPVTDPVEPATEPEGVLLGDVNGDGTVNASDAALILISAAATGAGGESGLTAAQEAAAEVNADGVINASDAAVVLIYAAAVGSGKTDAKITDYVH